MPVKYGEWLVVSANRLRTGLFLAIVALASGYLVVGAALNFSGSIVGAISWQLLPVWISMALIFSLSYRYRRRFGFYGKLFDSTIAMVGFALVLFWVLVGAMDLIATHNELDQLSGMKNKKPGTPFLGGEGRYHYSLLGGDNLARDVFSRVVKGAWIVVQIAPLAAVFPL